MQDIEQIKREIRNAKDPIEAFIIVFEEHLKDSKEAMEQGDKRLAEINSKLNPLYEAFTSSGRTRKQAEQWMKNIILWAAVATAVTFLYERVRTFLRMIIFGP